MKDLKFPDLAFIWHIATQPFTEYFKLVMFWATNFTTYLEQIDTSLIWGKRNLYRPKRKLSFNIIISKLCRNLLKHFSNFTFILYHFITIEIISTALYFCYTSAVDYLSCTDCNLFLVTHTNQIVQ